MNMSNPDNCILQHKFIVFCGDHYNPLTLIRSLGEDWIAPIVILAHPSPYLVPKSKYIGTLHRVNTNEEGFQLLYEKYGNEELKPFVYSCSDDIESLLDTNFSILENKFYFFNAGTNGGITHFMDKEMILRAAEQCGIPVPKSEVVKHGSLPATVPFPIITKSIKSTVGGWKNDVFVCRNEKELLESYNYIKSDPVLIEEYIEKDNELCIDGISINGGQEIFMPFQANYIRFTNKSYGNYMTISPFRDLELERKIKQLFRLTKFSGIFSIEFLITKDNELKFLEINFRHSTWALSSKLGGANLPKIWAQSMLAQQLETGKLELREQPFTAMAELSDFNDHVRHGNLSFRQWIKDFRNCECTYIYNSKDKKPFYSLITHSLLIILRKYIRI